MTGKGKDIVESYMSRAESRIDYGFDCGLSEQIEDIEYQLIGLIKGGA